MAVAAGNAVHDQSRWSMTFMVYMRKPLTPELQSRTRSRHPDLVYFEENGGPHVQAYRGFRDGDYSIGFPWKPSLES
jgi:hypothetical protein